VADVAPASEGNVDAEKYKLVSVSGGGKFQSIQAMLQRCNMLASCKLHKQAAARAAGAPEAIRAAVVTAWPLAGTSAARKTVQLLTVRSSVGGAGLPCLE
jgi:hypothetical protein